MKAQKDGIQVGFKGKNVPEFDSFDKVLVSIGRTPNGKLIDCEKTGVHVDDWGFINVDKQMKTNISNIYAIGDIVGRVRR
jgi:dihydrolipoamide dehydrogenase